MQVGIFMYKNFDLPVFSVYHDYNTRNRSEAVSNFQRLSLTQHSIYFTGPKVWNSIPQIIKSSDSLSSFKQLFKMHLVQNYNID